MIIEWKKNCLKIIPLTKDAGEAVKRLGKNKIILLPGNNEIDDVVWDSIKEYKSIQKSLESGQIKIKEYSTKEVEKKEMVEEENEKGEKKKVEKKTKIKVVKGKTLKDLDPDKAREIVENTYDIPTLEKWRNDEGRADIRNMIDDKIKEIKDYKIDPNIGGSK